MFFFKLSWGEGKDRDESVVYLTDASYEEILEYVGEYIKNDPRDYTVSGFEKFVRAKGKALILVDVKEYTF